MEELLEYIYDSIYRGIGRQFEDPMLIGVAKCLKNKDK